MPVRSTKLIPVSLAAGAIGLVCLLHVSTDTFPGLDLFRRLEWMTRDWRVRCAANHPAPVAANLGAVFIDDTSLDMVNQGLGFTWPWPRQLYGRLLLELRQQGAQAVAFDILFQELHPAEPRTDVMLQRGLSMSSDTFFAEQVRRSSNIVLACFGETLGRHWSAIPPAPLFRTNAWAVGHATSEADEDGVLRRARPYKDDPAHGRLWHMGILLAAKELELDLDRAQVEPDRIVLRGQNGVERTIPLDDEGMFHIDWSLTWNDPRITKGSFLEATGLSEGFTSRIEERVSWKDKLIVVGSIGSGNNISDLGSTPLGRQSYLVSKHWNVANSLLTDRFPRKASFAVELGLILLLGGLAAGVTCRWRAPWPTILIALVGVAYVGVAVVCYVQSRYWLPLVLPVCGGLGFTHAVLVTWQVVFEQREKRHVKQVFSRLVSPDVVAELLQAEKLNLGGARRTITVLFADVRGFTETTDRNQEAAEAYVREHALTGAAADAYFDAQARETLATVNTFLAAFADQIKQHHGTLDKYIGDCVMAFWGAPVLNEFHASACVRAAIDAQRAVEKLNQQRFEENQRREHENLARAAQGRPLLTSLPLLSLGTGISTGPAVVGLMGSEAHILNYTVFGHDVNLASRLESIAGRGRIIISESTFQALAASNPHLAQSCRAQAPVTVKGIRTTIQIYEVPWNEEAAASNEWPPPDLAAAC